MPRKRKMEIADGDRFGHLTVIREDGRDRFSHIRYLVRCDCGKEYSVNRGYLFSADPMCAECALEARKRKTAEDLIGTTVNNWFVIGEAEGTNVRKFYCRCICCGTVSIRSKAQIEHGKTGRCKSCPPERPDYRFRYDGNTAIGTLPDGSEFMIDAEDEQRVNQWRWQLHQGYIRTQQHEEEHLLLHNFILGQIPEGLMVDHINRNPLDCRKENLRIVTPQQNAMNKSMAKNNTSGYVGAFYDKSRDIYGAKIGLGNKDIRLGYSKDLVTCAQMYNIAADLLYGEFRGHMNDVPPPPEELIQKVKDKCRPYMKEAFEATRPCGLLLCAEAG